MTWIIDSLQRMICGLHGHETVLQFEPNRLSLRCLNCTYETPGWTLGSTAGPIEPSMNAGSSGRDRSGFIHKVRVGFDGLARRHPRSATT